MKLFFCAVSGWMDSQMCTNILGRNTAGQVSTVRNRISIWIYVTGHLTVFKREGGWQGGGCTLEYAPFLKMVDRHGCIEGSLSGQRQHAQRLSSGVSRTPDVSMMVVALPSIWIWQMFSPSLHTPTDKCQRLWLHYQQPCNHQCHQLLEKHGHVSQIDEHVRLTRDVWVPAQWWSVWLGFSPSCFRWSLWLLACDIKAC